MIDNCILTLQKGDRPLYAQTEDDKTSGLGF